jgi:hypothetical protein
MIFNGTLVELAFNEVGSVVGGCKCMCAEPPRQSFLTFCCPCCSAHAASRRVGIDLSSALGKHVGEAKDISDCMRICSAAGMEFNSCV